ncbi:hypothetical protein FSP39_016475 [Pinctada imbricata]|uniref:GH18 domain-containing protein n=1 Tax=Pinctada imbricata TaxID=66713 RepID=A0AA88XDE9_PINIB|nr:hypothetical protein FSP39_016475 [Pinctada imbricata]
MRVCYFTNWSSKRKYVASRFQLGDIDPNLCTHLVYAFATINPNKRILKKTETDDDNGSLDNKQGRYFEFTKLKEKYPHLKTMLSVGGQNTKGLFEGKMDSSASIRQFADNIRIYLKDRNFDGVDIDWEYPAKFYKDRFTEFLRALREDFDQYAQEGHPRLLLSIAAAPGKDDIDSSYDVAQISRYVDFINVMAYDYYGQWSHSAGYNSPLYTTDPSSTLSQNWTINYYLRLGAPPHKLVMGINAAAVGLTLKDASDNKPGAPVINGGVPKGPILEVPGRRSYQEMCSLLRTSGFSTHWDQGHAMTYALKGNQWFGYETERSVKTKVEYAMNLGLGGVMFWSLDIDDFTGNYCKRGRYPLLTAIAKTSQEYKPIITTTQTTKKPTTKTQPITSSHPLLTAIAKTSQEYKPIITTTQTTKKPTTKTQPITSSQSRNSSTVETVSAGNSSLNSSQSHETFSVQTTTESKEVFETTQPHVTFPVQTTPEKRGGFRMFYVIDSASNSKSSCVIVFCLLFVIHIFIR